MGNYIALTFGPITRVISLANTTRGMWAASYLFSYLAKNIIAPFVEIEPTKKRVFLLPYINETAFSDKFDGAGVFPDRYIFEAKDGDFELLADKVKEVIGKLAERIAPNDVDCATSMLMQYLKVYFFKTRKEEGEDDRSFVKRCEEQLALLEQHDSFIPSIPQSKHYLSKFINSESLSPMRFLLDDAGIGKFKSIVNISTGDDGLGYKVISEKLKPYEKYIAIVYADGDSMGGAFSTVRESSELSKRLFEFNKTAIAAIKEFDAQPVYIGGDDLFFFAPIYNPDKGSIFTLLDTLDQSFHSTLGENSPATLSFGVSITYFKYPMSEAVKLSQELLSKAKGYGGDLPDGVKPLKNNILFALQKHSGQSRSALLHKGCVETGKKMNNMINKYIKIENNDNMQLVSSVMHNLREHEPVLLNAISDNRLLKQYFNNNYNEPAHDSFKGFFDDVYEFLSVVYREHVGKTNRLKNSLESPIESRPSGYDVAYAALDLCYATLQFIHLVNLKKQ